MNDNTEIGRLILLDASFVKRNVPLVNKETGDLERVNKDKYFSGDHYLRYYMITDEAPSDEDVVWAYEKDPKNGYQITFLNQVKNRELKEVFKCYPVSNSIIPRIHDGYGKAMLNDDIEYFRFTTIHGKYSGFPTTQSEKVSQEEAQKRWSFIFDDILGIESNTETKRKIGSLFGGIQNFDLMKEETMQTLIKYTKWLKHKI